ncbi:MAG: ATP-dependent DNA helicase RecG [Burkholderiales bacterium]|jgi:ATP-dependent DNA helicase RecG|nr:ATP-dependent DNA helicase RecG [Burkholderiales bacterium]
MSALSSGRRRAAEAAESQGNHPGSQRTTSLAKRLGKLGLAGRCDLVLHLPLRYEDETRITPVSEARAGEPVLVEVEVVESTVAFRPRRQLVVKARDASGLVVMRFLNFYPSQQKALAAGAKVRAFGELRPGFFGGEMVHPRCRVLRRPEPLATSLTPVYPTTAGLPQWELRKLVDEALASCPLTETVPEAIRQPLGLPGFAEAVLALHRPPAGADLASYETHAHPAWRRVKFDELLGQQLSMRAHYRARRAQRAPSLGADGALTRALLARLPFRLTAAQARVWDEIARDLASAHPMNRLLQGDVGSGKTIVAALAALRAVESGHQAAVMAPTEILAEQHFRKFSEWLAPLGVRVVWVAGGQKKAERRAALEAIAGGETQIAVGTHALFQEGVAFARLALAIVDEQHRFGVHQRLALREKGSGASREGAIPHQLMMSATPIPRTLSMSYYADLDVSVIDALPPGRTPVVTKLVSESRRDEVIARIREACSAGQQAYWVCPLVEESEALELQTAIDTHAALSTELAGLRVGLVHGRLAPADKAAVMASFKAGEVDVLVATTVIEVGVDVPNASLMVIEHAERFGLAQLHQLRGRVGRGVAESACILLYRNPLSETARARLKVIYEHADGFVVAREDLMLRGPGEFLGVRQSGVPLLRFADLALDADLVDAARAAAERMLSEFPDAAAAHVERWASGRADLLKA